METRDTIVARFAATLEQIGCSERFFGDRAVGDHKFMHRLRHSSVTLSRIERAEQWLSDRVRLGDFAQIKRAGKIARIAE